MLCAATALRADLECQKSEHDTRDTDSRYARIDRTTVEAFRHKYNATPLEPREQSDWTLEAEDGRCATRKWFTEILFTPAGPAQ